MPPVSVEADVKSTDIWVLVNVTTALLHEQTELLTVEATQMFGMPVLEDRVTENV